MSEENLEIVRHAVARWGAGDDDGLLDFLISISAPDIELYSRFGGLSGEPYRGHDGLRAWPVDIEENFERLDPWLDETRAAGATACLPSVGSAFGPGRAASRWLSGRAGSSNSATDCCAA